MECNKGIENFLSFPLVQIHYLRVSEQSSISFHRTMNTSFKSRGIGEEMRRDDGGDEVGKKQRIGKSSGQVVSL